MCERWLRRLSSAHHRRPNCSPPPPSPDTDADEGEGEEGGSSPASPVRVRHRRRHRCRRRYPARVPESKRPGRPHLWPGAPSGSHGLLLGSTQAHSYDFTEF